MAELNPRLLELIEVLVEAQLGWLAIEVIEGIQIGRGAQLTPQELAQAREDALRRETSEQPSPDVEVEQPNEPVDRIDQPKWAVDYINSRIQDVLKQSMNSLESLDTIISESKAQYEQDADRDLYTRKPRETELVLLVSDEIEYKTSRRDIKTALENFEVLQIAFRTWLEAATDKREQ